MAVLQPSSVVALVGRQLQRGAKPGTAVELYVEIIIHCNPAARYFNSKASYVWLEQCVLFFRY
jgi:hypothetical protein